uniref:General transcription factor II-I repeat domain-containing protein 2A n=1 Tax=Cacopsylla melanoneura TaxID=428564 RepID=A0A8D8QN91_9HEMI
MSDVIKIVNFIRSRGLNHRQFQAFLEEISAEYDDVPYFSQVRWLSAGRVLKRFYELRKEIEQFLLSKDQPTAVFSESERLSELAYLADITAHLNGLNTQLQGKNNLVTHLMDLITAFESKLDLWNRQLKNEDFTHFPCLAKCKTPERAMKYEVQRSSC